MDYSTQRVSHETMERLKPYFDHAHRSFDKAVQHVLDVAEGKADMLHPSLLKRVSKGGEDE